MCQSTVASTKARIAAALNSPIARTKRVSTCLLGGEVGAELGVIREVEVSVRLARRQRLALRGNRGVGHAPLLRAALALALALVVALDGRVDLFLVVVHLLALAPCRGHVRVVGWGRGYEGCPIGSIMQSIITHVPEARLTESLLLMVGTTTLLSLRWTGRARRSSRTGCGVPRKQTAGAIDRRRSSGTTHGVLWERGSSWASLCVGSSNEPW